jgi:hypothetical protein
MNKLILTSILILLSSNALAMQDGVSNEIDMVGMMIVTIPLIILFSTVFIYYKNKKSVVTKKSYSSTNVIIDKSKYKTPNQESDKEVKEEIIDTLDIITDIPLITNPSTKKVSALAINDVINNSGDKSSGESTLDFDLDLDLDLDFDWD